MSDTIVELPVSEIIKETTDAVSLCFKIPEEKRDTFQFTSGQYLTIELEKGGQTYRRSYSMSSSPDDDFLRVTVKAVPGGKVSPYLCYELKAGDTLRVLPPDGNFTVEPKVENKKLHVLIGAGSGITPLMSMIRNLLDIEVKSRVVLLYGSRVETDIIFEKELEKLEKEYEGQFYVYHTISKPTKIKKKGITGLLGAKESLWRGLKGRIDKTKILHVLYEHEAYSAEKEFYICGPGKMIDNVTLHLSDYGVKSENIHKEYFTVDGANKKSSSDIVSEAEMEVILDKKVIKTTLRKKKTILETLLDEGHDPPYSCTSGACSTCIGKLEEGQVHMDICLALDDEEISEGYILTCQSRALTEKIKVNFDV